MSKDFFKTLGLKYPLVVAPMAGGPSTAELVIASSQAGALGSIGAAYFDANGIRKITEQVRTTTKNPLSINLFTPHYLARVSTEKLVIAKQKTQKYRDELKIPSPALEPPYEEDFMAQMEMVLELKPTVFSFVFGLLDKNYIREAQKRGIYVLGTATHPDEAALLAESGVDGIVLQGIEAGGHRGIFNATAADPEIPTLELVTRVRRQTKLPLIAAGGIMNKSDIQNFLAAGADMVQMGTAFLATQEAGTSPPYRKKLLESQHRVTRTTRAFSGRWARGICNRFMNEMDAMPEAILPFPAQNKFTRDLRAASVAQDNAEFISLWCGSGQGALWTGSTKALIENLFRS